MGCGKRMPAHSDGLCAQTHQAADGPYVDPRRARAAEELLWGARLVRVGVYRVGCDILAGKDCV